MYIIYLCPYIIEMEKCNPIKKVYIVGLQKIKMVPDFSMFL